MLESTEEELFIYLATEHDLELLPSIKSSYFKRFVVQLLVQLLSDYVSKYEGVPPLVYYAEEIVARGYKLDKDEQDELVSILCKLPNKVYNNGEAEYWHDTLVDFIRSRRIREALLKSRDLLNQKQWDKIRDVINNATNSVIERKEIVDWAGDFENRVKRLRSRFTASDRVPTGLYSLDGRLFGGLGPGELGILLGFPKSGKSFLLTSFGAHALLAKKRVFHITLEMDKDTVGLRYDSHLTGYKALDLLNGNFDSKVVFEVKSKFTSLLKLLDESDLESAFTLSRLDSYLDSLVSLGEKPQLVLLDYANLVAVEDLPKSSTLYVKMDHITAGLHTLAKKYYVPIWCICRVNRQGDVAESFGVLYNADVVVQLEPLKGDVSQLKLTHARGVPGALTIPLKFDFEHSKVEELNFFAGDNPGDGREV